MTTVQRVAQVFGWIFVVVAVWGFFVTGGSMEADMEMAPRLWGLFPVNVLHNLVHLAFGVWGIAAARSFTAAKSYAIIAGIIYLVLAVLGFIIPETFGLIPIGGNDIWLHALLGVVLVGAGATAGPAATAPETTTAPGAAAPRVQPGPGGGSTTASSPQGTVTRPPAEPAPPPTDRPTAPPAQPDRPPQQQDRPASPPPPPPPDRGDRTP